MSSTTTDEAKIIDGKAVAKEIRADIKKQVEELKKEHDVLPGLATILVGDRTDSAMYVKFKKRAAKEVGFHSVDIKLPETVTEEQLIAEVKKCIDDKAVHGILLLSPFIVRALKVQLPLPKHINEDKVLASIPHHKDVDGFSAQNIGCVELIQRTGVDVKGKDAVVVGRSNIVGMPMAHLLRSMDCTVTVCHSRTKDIKAHVRRADILVAAIGSKAIIDWARIKNNSDNANTCMIFIKQTEGYRLVGDVDFAAAKKVAAHITPVPGGVGPMTIAMLLRNTLNLARYKDVVDSSQGEGAKE